MESIELVVEFVEGQVVYAAFDPESPYTYVVRGFVVRKNHVKYICFSPELGEVDFEASELVTQRPIF